VLGIPDLLALAHNPTFIVGMAVSDTYVGRSESVCRVAVPRHEVDSEGVSPRGEKEAHRDDHGQSRTVHIGSRTRQRRDTCTSDDTAHYPARAALGMPPQPAHSQGHDGREADALEEQRDVQHRHARVPALGDGRPDEDDAHGHESEEHPARPDEVHYGHTDEAANSKARLRTRQELGRQGVGRARSGIVHVVDEVTTSCQSTKACRGVDRGGSHLAIATCAPV
jgi:hypothetical protein